MDIEEFKDEVTGEIRRPGSLILPPGFVSSFPPYVDAPETPLYDDAEIIKLISNPNRRDITKLLPFEKYGTNQGQYSCHDSETEVLTENGWVAWPDYDGSTLLATVNPSTLHLEYQKPIAVTAEDYEGPMFKSTKTDRDFLVTPNHRMFVRKWDNRGCKIVDEYSFVEARSMGWYATMLSAPTGIAGCSPVKDYVFSDGLQISGDDFVALLSLIISDGWVGSGDTVKHQVSFCCFREDFQPVVRALASRCGFGELPGRPGVWVRTDKLFADWCRENLYVDSPYRSWNKRIPRMLVMAPKEQLSVFFEFFGDQKHKTPLSMFFSSSVALIENLQEMLFRFGFASRITERTQASAGHIRGRAVISKRPQYTLTVRRKKPLSIGMRDGLTTEHYVGKVYCATVPNSILITRRNGFILISGNSCNGFAAASGLTFARRLTGIDDGWVGSGSYVYSLINGNRDNGSQLEDGLVVIGKYGAPSRTTVPYNLIYRNQYPRNSVDVEAAKTKGLQAYRCKTKQAWRTALAAGWMGIAAVHADGRVINYRGTGIMPLANGPGNHAVLISDMRILKGTEAYQMTNSWGISWGDHGRTWLVWDHFAQTFNNHAFYVIPGIRVVK